MLSLSISLVYKASVTQAALSFSISSILFSLFSPLKSPIFTLRVFLFAFAFIFSNQPPIFKVVIPFDSVFSLILLLFVLMCDLFSIYLAPATVIGSDLRWICLNLVPNCDFVPCCICNRVYFVSLRFAVLRFFLFGFAI